MGWTIDGKLNSATTKLAATAVALGVALSPAQGLAASCESDEDCTGGTCVEGECVSSADDTEKAPAEPDQDVAADEKSSTADEATTTDSDGTNPKLIGTGIGLAGLGAFGVGIGIAAVVGGAGTSNEYVSPGTQPPNATPPVFADKNEAGLQIAGGIILGIGGALLITGVILIPVGATSGPGGDEAAVVIEPLLGPTSGGLRVHF